MLQLGHLLSQLGDVFPHLAVQHPSLDAADHRLTGAHRGIGLRLWIHAIDSSRSATAGPALMSML